ncbi:hypothetical protein LTR66_008595 [Elasticomyces elasticus]|nr:hypothetical protein LTR66_008595 [Elasticomyces elasticus]
MYGRLLRTALLALFLNNTVSAQRTTTSPSTSTPTSTYPCNNAEVLCSRPYNNITHLGAHDSPFVRDESTNFSESGNQFYNSTVQLSAGVRLLTAQVHRTNGTGTDALHICHTSCGLADAGTLTTWLASIKTWLSGNPHEVVTILLVNSDHATASELAASYEAARLVDYSYIPPSLTTAPVNWPTLSTLINNGTRLLNFVANLDPASNTAAPYLMNEFSFIFENAYDNTSPSNFSCTPDRPSSVSGNAPAALKANLMPLMNHFLYNSGIFGIETPDWAHANVTNAPNGGTGNLGTAAAACTGAYGRAPTFVLVDFFNVGPAIDTVDALNGVSGSTSGRTTTSTAALSRSTNAAGKNGGSTVAMVIAAMIAFCLLR